MRYVVKVSRAHMPNSMGISAYRYYNIAVMEMEDDAPEPKMISERCRGCRRIVARWMKQHIGTTVRSAGYRALQSAHKLAAEKNQEVAWTDSNS